MHRIGRTGRAGATGVAYTFFAEQDAKYASDLVKVLEGANQRVPPEIRDMASRGGGMGRSRRWGSGTGGRDGGRGGRNDSSYGGRDGGRGGWGMAPSSSSRLERGGGRGADQDQRDRYYLHILAVYLWGFCLPFPCPLHFFGEEPFHMSFLIFSGFIETTSLTRVVMKILSFNNSSNLFFGYGSILKLGILPFQILCMVLHLSIQNQFCLRMLIAKVSATFKSPVNN